MANTTRNLKIIAAATNLGIPNIHGSELAPNFISESLKLEFDTVVDVETSTANTVLGKANTSSISDVTSNHTQKDLLRYLLRLFNVIYKELAEREFAASFSQTGRNLQDLITVIGGDHSIAIATWQAAIKKYYDHKFAIIWIDAHLDAHNFETTMSGNMHGMPVATLLGCCKPLEFIDDFDYVRAQDIYILGVRDYEAQERGLLEKLGVKIYYMDEVKSRSFGAIMDEILDSIEAKGQHFGISLDLDYFDPSDVSGVNTAVAGGGAVDEVVQYFAHQLPKDKMEVFELVEFNSNKDVGGLTVKCISQLLEAIR